MTPNSTSPGGTTLLPGTGASLLVRSELMQGYVTAQAIPTAGAQLAAVADARGVVQIFTLGDGGQVFNLSPSADTQTGWSVRPLRVPVAVQHLAVGTEIDGTVVVLACGSDNTLYWKTDEPFSAWQSLGRPFGSCTVQALRSGYDDTASPDADGRLSAGGGYPHRPVSGARLAPSRPHRRLQPIRRVRAG